MLVELDVNTGNMLRKMWLDALPLSARFKTEYNASNLIDINNNLSFSTTTHKYDINSIELMIDDAYLHYIDFNLHESIPRHITNDFIGHSVVLNQLTNSSRQNINLFFPVENNCTDVVITFIRESDLNSKMGENIFSHCRSLPPGLKEMAVTQTSSIHNSDSHIYSNFHLQDLHINKINLSWQNYLNYLIDNEYLDTQSASTFFSPRYTRLNEADLTSDTGHSAAMYFPLAISSSLHQDQPLISLQTAQVNYSPLALNLNFETSSDNLSKYYCCIVYFNRYSIDFNLAQNAIKVSPVLCK